MPQLPADLIIFLCYFFSAAQDLCHFAMMNKRYYGMILASIKDKENKQSQALVRHFCKPVISARIYKHYPKLRSCKLAREARFKVFQAMPNGEPHGEYTRYCCRTEHLRQLNVSLTPLPPVEMTCRRKKDISATQNVFAQDIERLMTFLTTDDAKVEKFGSKHFGCYDGLVIEHRDQNPSYSSTPIRVRLETYWSDQHRQHTTEYHCRQNCDARQIRATTTYDGDYATRRELPIRDIFFEYDADLSCDWGEDWTLTERKETYLLKKRIECDVLRINSEQIPLLYSRIIFDHRGQEKEKAFWWPNGVLALFSTRHRRSKSKAFVWKTQKWTQEGIRTRVRKRKDHHLDNSD